LALWTDERPAAGDNQTLDRRLAAAAGLALAVVHPVTHLKPAGSIVGIAIVADARSAGPDCLREDRPDCPVETPNLPVAEAIRPCGRVNPCPVQRLVAVDVANAPEDPLVEQQGFDLPPMSQPTGEFLARHLKSIRADQWPSPTDPPDLAGCLIQKPDTAESARVAEAELEAAFAETDAEVRVRFDRHLRGYCSQSPRHSEMNHQGDTSVDLDEDLFADAFDTLDPAPVQRGAQRYCCAMHHVGTVQADPLDRAAGDPLGNTSTHDLDFG